MVDICRRLQIIVPHYESTIFREGNAMPRFGLAERGVGRFMLALLLTCHLAANAAADSTALLVKQARAHLAGLASRDGLSGVVLIARDGRPILEQAYGYANLADKVRNRVDTKFNMASMGKMFTAVAVLQLAEAGKLSLADKV